MLGTMEVAWLPDVGVAVGEDDAVVIAADAVLDGPELELEVEAGGLEAEEGRVLWIMSARLCVMVCCPKKWEGVLPGSAGRPGRATGR